MIQNVNKDAKSTSRNTLVISPTFPYPITTGNRARIYELLLNLKKIGHDVYFLYINTEPFDEGQMGRNSWSEETFIAPYRPPHKTLVKRITRKIKRILGQESAFLYSIDSWYDNSLDSFLMHLSKKIKFDVVIVEYVFFSKALDCFGADVLKIIDTHDIYTNRHRIYLKNHQNPHWYSTTEANEAKGLNRADVIIAIQQKEKDFFSRITEKKVILVGHNVALHEPMPRYSIDKAIVFVGSTTPMNVQGIIFFVNDVLPKIREHFPILNLILTGSICDVVDNFDHCIKLGRVENLKSVYDKANVVINPISYGTGLKIKTIEALGYGKPLVTTSIGAEGLENGINQAFLVADTAESFAQAVINVLSDPTFANNLSRNAYDFAKAWNEASIRELKNVLFNGEITP